MPELILRAEPRTVLGKKVKALRRAGRLPGVVYGPVMSETIPVSVETRELTKFYATYGSSTLFTLQWEGGRQQVFIREVQVDPVRYAPLHVDFFAPNLAAETTAMVPVVTTALNPDAVGILNVLHNEVPVRGLPTEIPPELTIDVSQLVEVGDVVRAGDVKLPAGLAHDLPEDEAIAQLILERSAEEVTEGEAAAAAVAEESGEA
jgi:large subunit ribosomal protein L25